MDKASKFKALRLRMGLAYAPLLLTWQEYIAEWANDEDIRIRI